jgi:hypothetical protein
VPDVDVEHPGGLRKQLCAKGETKSFVPLAKFKRAGFLPAVAFVRGSIASRWLAPPKEASNQGHRVSRHRRALWKSNTSSVIPLTLSKYG